MVTAPTSLGQEATNSSFHNTTKGLPIVIGFDIYTFFTQSAYPWNDGERMTYGVSLCTPQPKVSAVL